MAGASVCWIAKDDDSSTFLDVSAARKRQQLHGFALCALRPKGGPQKNLGCVAFHAFALAFVEDRPPRVCVDLSLSA